MTDKQTVQDAYIAYYGRPADPGGLAHWTARLAEAGGSMDGLLAEFGASEEFSRRFGNLDNEALVDGIYQRLFGRDADPEGQAFYVGQLERGEASLGSIAMDVLNGARNEDLVVLNKIRETANIFTDLVEEAGLDYSGERAEAIGANAVSIFHGEWHRYWQAEVQYISDEHRRMSPDLVVGPNDYRVHYEQWAPAQVAQLYEPGEVMDIDRHYDIGGTPTHTSLRWNNRDSFTWHGSLSRNSPEFGGLNDAGSDVDTVHLLDLPPGTYEFRVDFLSPPPDNTQREDYWFVWPQVLGEQVVLVPSYDVFSFSIPDAEPDFPATAHIMLTDQWNGQPIYFPVGGGHSVLSEETAVTSRTTAPVYEYALDGVGPVFLIRLEEWDGSPISIPLEAELYDSILLIRDDVVLEHQDVPPLSGSDLEPGQWDYEVVAYRQPLDSVDGTQTALLQAAGDSPTPVTGEYAYVIRQIHTEYWGTGAVDFDDDEEFYRFTLFEDTNLSIGVEAPRGDGSRLYEWSLEYISEDIDPAPGTLEVPQDDWIWPRVRELLFFHYYEDNIL